MHAVDCSLARPVRAAALLAAATIFLAAPGGAMAQDTRAEIIRQEQADKLRTVTPPALNGAEKIVKLLEQWGLLTGEPRGLYPLLDSVYPGGGVAAGLGARKPFGDNGAISVIGAYSINGFSRAQTDVSLPSFASNRGRVSLTAGYLVCAGREVLRHRRRLGQGRQDILRLHAASRGRTPRLCRQPPCVHRWRGQLPRHRHRFGRRRAVDRGAVLCSRQPGPRARSLQVRQQHRARGRRLAATAGLLGHGRAVPRRVR